MQCLVPRSQLKRIEHAACPPMMKVGTLHGRPCYHPTHIWRDWGLRALRTMCRLIVLTHILYWAGYQNISPKERKNGRQARLHTTSCFFGAGNYLLCLECENMLHTLRKRSESRFTWTEAMLPLVKTGTHSTKYRLTPEIHAKYLKLGCVVGLHQAPPMGIWWSKSGYLGGAWESLLLTSTWGAV